MPATDTTHALPIPLLPPLQRLPKISGRRFLRRRKHSSKNHCTRTRASCSWRCVCVVCCVLCVFVLCVVCVVCCVLCVFVLCVFVLCVVCCVLCVLCVVCCVLCVFVLCVVCICELHTNTNAHLFPLTLPCSLLLLPRRYGTDSGKVAQPTKRHHVSLFKGMRSSSFHAQCLHRLQSDLQSHPHHPSFIVTV